RSILDKVQAKLELSDTQLQPSRETLRTFGNMSSATVLFVLRHILDQPALDDRESICAMAFGPGLTVETALFTKVSPPPAMGGRAAEAGIAAHVGSTAGTAPSAAAGTESGMAGSTARGASEAPVPAAPAHA